MDVLFTAVCFFARLGVFIGCLLLLGGIEALSELHRRFLFCCLFAVLPPRHFFCCGWLIFKLQTHIPAANHRMVDSPPHLEREREGETCPSHGVKVDVARLWQNCGTHRRSFRERLARCAGLRHLGALPYLARPSSCSASPALLQLLG